MKEVNDSLYNLENSNKFLDKSSKIKEIDINLSLHTEGSHSVRYNSMCFIDEDLLIFPCGIYLNKYSYSKDLIIKRIIISQSIIFNVQKNNQYLITVCYNGKGAVIDIEEFSIIKAFDFKNGSTISNISFSLNLDIITISAEYYKDEDSKEIIEGASCVLFANENSQYELIKLIKSKDNLTEINSEDNLIIIEKLYKYESFKLVESENSLNFNYKLSLIKLKKFIDDTKNFENCVNSIYTFEKPVFANYLIKEKILEKNEEISYIMKCEIKDYVAISFYKRNILFIDIFNLNTMFAIEFEGKGFLGGIDFYKNNIYFTNKSKTLSKIDLSYLIQNYEKVNQMDFLKEKEEMKNDVLKLNLNNELLLNGEKLNEIDAKNMECHKKYLFNDELIMNNFSIHSLNYCLKVSPNENSLSLVNESGLHVFSNFSNKNYNLITRNSPIKITGVGLSINENADYFAVGDLEGNINIYQYNKSDQNIDKIVKNVCNLKISDSIRCLEWSQDDILYIGCISGKLFQVKPDLYKKIENKEGEKYIANHLNDLHSTITCIRIHTFYFDKFTSKNQNKKIKKNFIFLSTTKGNICIFYNCKHGFIRLAEFIAHPPQPENQDLRFGSLKYKSEVWSIAIKEKFRNEKENKLIFNIFSASEDQTIKIWETNLFDLIKYNDIIKGMCNKSDNILININDFSKIIEEIKSYKHHNLAVTSVDYKEVYFKNEKKRILASCSDDKFINIYDTDDNDEFTLIATLTTKDHVFGWHTITYLSLEEVNN